MPRTNSTVLTALTLSLPLCLVNACAKDTPTPPTKTGPEIYENASGALNEADIRGRLQGDHVDLQFPIRRKQKGRLEGSLTVRLVDLSSAEEPALGVATLRLSQIGERQTHTIRVEGIPANINRAATSAIVVDWTALLPDGQLRGRRSLYATLGQLEVQVRGTTDIPAGGSSPLRVVVRDPVTLTPLAGAEVVGALLEDSAPRELFRAQTDARGEATVDVRLPDGIEGGALRVDVTHDETHTWIQTALRTVQERRIFLSSDKTIYKPGQEVALRALALHSTTKVPLSGQSLVFEALDGKGNKVFKRAVSTSPRGVAAVTVPIDARVNEGDWTFRVELDSTKAQRKIPVQRYNLPKITVDVTTDRTFVLPSQSITGSVDARYVFGRPVADGDVTITAKLDDGNELARTTGRTDASGKLDFTLNVTDVTATEPRPLSIEATITDAAQQSETGATTLPLAPAPIVVQIISEESHLVPSTRNVAFVTVTDPGGRPLAADLDVDVDGQRMTTRTSADGVAEISFTPSIDATQVAIDVTARDGADRTHRRTLTLSTTDTTPLVIRTDRALYKTGDRAVVDIIAPSTAKRAYLDIYRGAQGVAQLVVNLNDGAARTQVQITKAMRGALLLDAFALVGPGEVVRGARRLLVDPEDRLQISMTTSRETFSPGDDAAMTVRVVDADGRPKVAALGLTVVDEATFALGGEPKNDLRTYFNADPNVLPADLRVLGQTPQALFSDADQVTREQLARLMFAKAGATSPPGIQFNSIREELPGLRDALKDKIERDAITMLRMVKEQIDDRTLSAEDAPRAVLMRAGALIDPFGRVYLARVGEGSRQWRLSLTSAGADEVHGTRDDVTVELRYRWVQYGENFDANNDDALANEGQRGGEVPEAGGMGPPTAPTEKGEARVRSDFRETIYVNPTLITDATGVASVSFPLADSITTWRATAQGSTSDGKLGSSVHRFTTFQEFFLDFTIPVSLTAGDELELPAVVYNYQSTPQTVDVTLEAGTWLQVLSPATQSVKLDPSEVRSVSFRVRVEQAGAHQLTLRATAGGVGDALVRTARVKPNGVALDQSVSDQLNGEITHNIHVPANAVANGTHVELVLTPGFASEAVSGVEKLLAEPSGCFEQTTSTAWPNTMVVRYLDTTGQATPETRKKGIDLITRGYQRLLTFESPTGGFNWWGNGDPGNRILSAIMLWHLKDMEALITTDEAVRQRTLKWLVDQQQADGSWESGDALHSGNEVLGTNDMRTTAFIAWALAHTGWADAAVERANAWIRSNQSESDDLYTTALAANALSISDADGSATATLLGRLDTLKEEVDGGRVKWPTDKPSWTGAGGDTAAIETTGLVAYGLIKANAYPENATKAMKFIVANKDSVGTWYNTQATMNALRALLAAASPTGSDAEGTLGVTVNGTNLPDVVITREDGDVYRSIDITEHVTAGDNSVVLNMQGTGDITYRLTRRSYVPQAPEPPAGPFELSVTHDSTSVSVGEAVTTTAVATYTGAGQRDQVIVQVGKAPGFVPMDADLDKLVQDGAVSRYEIRDTDVTFYLMGVQSNQPRQLVFRSVATLSVQAEAEGSSIYAYYEPSLREDLEAVSFTVR